MIRTRTEMDLSVIIPVYNEKDNLKLLHDKLKASLSGQYELIFIDDGSTDGSSTVLESLHTRDSRVVVIQFRKNYGQTSALSAGFAQARGRVIVTMDADLQNDPADIPALVDYMNKGYDVVSGWRYKRHDALLGKKLPSLLSNWLARRLTGLPLHDSGCSLKAYKKETVLDLHLMGEMHRFIPALVSLRGYRVGEMKVSHHSRAFGKSKYGTKRLLKGFLDLLFLKFWSDFSTRPLHFFGLLGAGVILLGSFLAAANLGYYVFILRHLSGIGPLLLFASLLILVGIQLLFFGFLAEIMARNYYASEKQESYYIKKILK